LNFVRFRPISVASCTLYCVEKLIQRRAFPDPLHLGIRVTSDKFLKLWASLITVLATFGILTAVWLLFVTLILPSLLRTSYLAEKSHYFNIMPGLKFHPNRHKPLCSGGSA
jgi:hypothetical protein